MRFGQGVTGYKASDAPTSFGDTSSGLLSNCFLLTR